MHMKFWQQYCNALRPKNLIKLAGFEPGIFGPGGGHDDHYATPPKLINSRCNETGYEYWCRCFNIFFIRDCLTVSQSGLPNKMFSKPKSHFGQISGGSCRTSWYIYGHLVYFTVIGFILRSFGIFYGHLVLFSVLVYCIKIDLATLV
jgi:hypothetical protein